MKATEVAASVEVARDGRTEVRSAAGVNAVHLAGVLRSVAHRLDPAHEADHLNHQMIGTEMASEEEAASVRTADDMVRRLESSTGAERVQQALTRVLASHRPAGNYSMLGCSCGTFEDIHVNADDAEGMKAAAELFEIHQAHSATLYILADIDAYAREMGMKINTQQRTRPDGSPL